MIQLNFNQKSNFEGVLCMGFFDCVHKGHIALIDEAKKYGQKVFVFTFSSDMSKVLSTKEGFIYSFEERLERLAEEGVYGVVSAEFSREFMANSKSEFLEKISGALSLKGLIYGEDYTFGFKGEGTPAYIQEFFSGKDIPLITVDKVLYNGEKASTTLAKSYMKQGDIKNLNALLGADYRLLFKKQNGQLSFVNLENRVLPKSGDYIGYIMREGKKLGVTISCVENVGLFVKAKEGEVVFETEKVYFEKRL